MEINNKLSDKAIRDLELVKEAVNGNQKSYSLLLSYYKESLYFMMLKMVKNEKDAEDLTIEAFAKAFKNLDSFVHNHAFSTWLFKIASNTAIDFLRTARKGKHISLDTVVDEENSYSQMTLISNTMDPEENMICGQKAELLEQILINLPEEYAKILKLRYWEEMSYQQISERLNLPIGTIKNRLYRSKELLITILKKNKLNIH